MKYIKKFENNKNVLYIANRELIEITDNLSNSLEAIYCYNNNLKSLPELPKSLLILDCSDNELTSLPELPDTLEHLNCSGNNLKFLPILPESLKSLICHYNNNLPYNNIDEYREWYFKTVANKFNI